MVITGFIHPGTSHTATTRIGALIGDIVRPTGLVIGSSRVVEMTAMPAKVANGVVARVVVMRIF